VFEQSEFWFDCEFVVTVKQCIMVAAFLIAGNLAFELVTETGTACVIMHIRLARVFICRCG
jgi:hypothetical protein